MLEMPGIPKGHITLVRGHSNTGKTTLLIEAAIEAQKHKYYLLLSSLR
jgi:KaiC/GvpD/RAD55 family RecA-like ATPase